MWTWVIGGVALLGGGYLIYKFVQESGPLSELSSLATTATSDLDKDPLSVTSLYGGVKTYGSDAIDDIGSGTTSTLDKIESWF